MKTPEANIKASAMEIQHVLYVKIRKTSKEVAINKNKNLFESDINPTFPMFLVRIIPTQDAIKLNIAFFDIETDFDPRTWIC